MFLFEKGVLIMIKHITKLLCTFNVSEKTLLELCPFYCQPNYQIYKLGLDHAIPGVKTTSNGSRGVAKGDTSQTIKTKKCFTKHYKSRKACKKSYH